ncbi:hypothetical protein quinque_013248 [Culex quinquefasciatus]
MSGTRSCRLCGHSTDDLVEIYGEQGLAADYARKISICWMCSQQLDTFHRFHEKINEIQHRLLGGEVYPQYVIQDHHRLGEEEFHIVEHIAEEEEEAEPEPEEIVPIVVEQEDEEQEGQMVPKEAELEERVEEEETMIELIPSNQQEDSFLMVKSEPANEQKEQLGVREVQEVEDTQVQVYEIRKSTRKKASKLEAEETRVGSEGEDDEEIHLKQKTVKKRNTQQIKQEVNKSARRSSPRRAKPKQRTGKKEYGDESEGESGDEFPARDSDNEEWPAAETMEKFPSKVLNDDGLLIVKGKRLEEMINRFYNLQCDLCKENPARFKVLPDLFQHYKTLHKQEGYVLCCQSKFTRYPAIIMHLARHLQPDAFKCDLCGYMVTRPRFLAAHRQTHLPEDQKPYACEHCPKRFCWKRALLVHSNQHKAPGERMVYECATCGKTYDTPGGLSAHKKNVHKTPNAPKISHVCEICANRFATSSGLKEHMTTIHQPREQGQLQCSVCSKWLMNARCLKVHMQLHSEVDLFCELCPYKTKKLSLLKRHSVTQHSEARPFPCDHCDCTFKHKRALTIHTKLKHSASSAEPVDKSPFKCNFCERKFRSSTNFYTHRKNHHPEELAAMKEQQEAERKLQRIRAGVEPDDVPGAHESTMVTTNPDGTRIITISSGAFGEPQSLIVLNITDGALCAEGGGE